MTLDAFISVQKVRHSLEIQKIHLKYRSSKMLLLFLVLSVVIKTSYSEEWITVENKEIWLSSQGKQWSGAVKQCQEMGGQLFVPDNEIQNQGVSELIKGNIWLGASDSETEGQFKSASNGKEVSYTNWSKNQPDNARNNENCIELRQRDGKWNDVRCTKTRRFVCERAKWTDELSRVLYSKIDYLLMNGLEIGNKFDLKNDQDPTNEDYQKYVYDPSLITVKPDCDTERAQCKAAWVQQRPDDIAFSSRKLLRLAFHDCVPYTNGITDGNPCDGCLNMDANLEHNNGLQYTIAVLEKLYQEPDFPFNAPTFPKSLKDMGISRADLWSYATMIALNEFFKQTQAQCSNPKRSYATTCDQYPCFVEPPDTILKMFKVGRKDCQAKTEASEFNQYLTMNLEYHPDQDAELKVTTKYFNDSFNMAPRESLALLGIHTIAQFNGMSSHRNYGWGKDKFFTNEYYRLLAQYPTIKRCGEEPRPTHYQVQGGRLFANEWPPPSPWANSTRNGRINWILFYENKNKTLGENNHSRMLTAEMGYYWKFQYDANGLPRGCPVFDGANKNAEYFAARRGLGYNTCAKQNETKDEFGEPISDAVELYAENGTHWMKDFVDAYTKMYQNGWPNLVDGPNNFWTHKCCIYERTSLKHVKFSKIQKLENTLECQKLCEEDVGCKFFMYLSDGTCKFTNEENEDMHDYDKYDTTVGHWYSGPAVCSDKQIPFCQFFVKNE